MKRLFIFIMGVMMAVAATSRTFDMKQLGADAKGIKPCTKLINQTIEKAASEGGGTIYFPAGTYLTATIHMKVTLHCIWNQVPLCASQTGSRIICLL